MFPLLKAFSLKVKIIIIYSSILGVGGLLTSYVGSRIVSSTILNQAASKVQRDLDTAQMIYEQELEKVKMTVHLGLFNHEVSHQISPVEYQRLVSRLDSIRRENQLDFLTLTDWNGNVVLRTPNINAVGDNVQWLSVVQAALSNRVVAATEIFDQVALNNENPILGRQALIQLQSEKDQRFPIKSDETRGLVLTAAAPVKFAMQPRPGALYGGILLNQHHGFIDRIGKLVHKEKQHQGANIGTISIFLKDLRIATTTTEKSGKRTVGRCVDSGIAAAVLEQGQTLSTKTFVLNDWYFGNYQPIRNLGNEIIGMLYVGQQLKIFTRTRDQVVFSFLGIASILFIVIIAMSYLVTRSITRPLGEMVDVTKSIAKGELDRVVNVNSRDELGQLAISFNKMVTSLKKMRLELEDWANTLEQKVKERTEALGKMQQKVVQAQRLASVGKLAAGIAHEINNPLGGILVFSSLILEQMSEDDPNRENLEEIIHQTMRCRDIVKGLLQFSRQEPGKVTQVKINDTLNTTLSLIEKQALFHNIQITRKFSEKLPPIMGDNSQLQQVFMNIILNAVQAMDGVGELTLTTWFHKKEEKVVIEISDTGCGIAPELIDRIFDPFFTTKEVGQGTGLGLAIAYGIVTKYGGRMAVTSEVNQGATFTIRFPIAAKGRFSVGESESPNENLIG